MRGFAFVALGILLGALPTLAICARLAAVSRARREREQALRGALEARVWEDSLPQGDPLETDPEELRRRRHEANNALSTALLSAQFLVAASGAEARAGSDQHVAADAMVDALQRLKRIIGQGRAAATTTGPRAPQLAATELVEGVLASVERTRALHPRVAIEVTLASPALERARVLVRAGGDGLARVLDALLRNACEGDGERAASRVTVRVGAEGEVEVVSLEIADDGPGFPKDSLAGPTRPFASTKAGRLGLGLYTAERILFASGGSLRRENGAVGGARVTVFLAAANEPAPSQ